MLAAAGRTCSRRLLAASQLQRCSAQLQFSARAADQPNEEISEWKKLVDAGEKVNPCRSRFHPAAALDPTLKDAPVQSVQKAYDPKGICYVCGPAHPQGVHLETFRTEGGVESRCVAPEAYQELPGIVSPGFIGSLVNCHGVWSAGIALMDRSILPRPPLMVTKRFSVSINEAEQLAPGQDLLVRGNILRVDDKAEPFTVEMSMEVVDAANPGVRFASGSGVFQKIGSIRSFG